MIAGNNIDIAQNDNDVTISTKRDVEFDSVTIGSVKVDSDGIYAGKKKLKVFLMAIFPISVKML